MPNPRTTLEEKALDLLAQAHRSRFKDKPALLLALTQLNHLCEKNPKNINAWILMAYILIIADQSTQAVQALNHLRKLAPNHPDVETLFHYIQARANPVEDLETHFHNELDTLLTEVFKFPKKTQIKNWSAQNTHYQALFLRYQTLRDHQETLLKKGTYLGLAQQIDPIEYALKQEKHRLNVSSDISKLNVTLDQAFAQLKSCLNNASTLNESEIQAWINKSNAWANQLEEWQVQGHDIGEIEYRYSQCLNGIQSLVDWIDED